MSLPLSPTLATVKRDLFLPEACKVKAVDGAEGLAVAYMERYGLTYEQASIWTRCQGAVWSGLEADFVLLGESPEIETRIRSFLDLYPDFRLWWENASADPGLVGPEFRTYVERLRRQP